MNGECLKITIYFSLMLTVVACNYDSGHQSQSDQSNVINLHAAKGFSIDSTQHSKTLRIYDTHTHSKVVDEFVLRPQNYQATLKNNEIKVPCKRIVCLSSTQLAYLIELNALENIVGINSSKHLFNKKIKEKVTAKKIAKVGKEGSFNIETIINLNPDVIFVSPFKTGGYDALKNLGIPLVPMASYGENTPLGRAEWMKMMALFTGDSPKADRIFNQIESNYKHLKSLTDSIQKRPTVFSGKMKGGTWYVAGGNSFFAHYFRDAGADYVIKDNNTAAEPMDYESLYNQAWNADYWRLLTSSPIGFNKEALKAEDERYADFKAFKTGNILLCNVREIPYREESSVKPDVLLADYIHHFHPDLLPNHQPVYWKKINE